MMALFDPGDEIVLFEPYYGYHLNAAVVAGLGIRTVPLSPPDFAIDPDRVRAALTPRTRAILVNTPMNPCGKVFDREELLAIAEICHEHDLICLTDEVYEYLIYDDRTHVSMASLPGMRDRTITLSSYSKTFSITGWRVGYMCGPAPLAEAVGLVNDLYYICAPAPLQRAVATGVRDLPPAYYADMRADYARKREIFCGVLREVGLEPIVPDGAYYVLADVKSLGCETAKDAAMRLLHEAGVASVPGSAFYTGATGEGLTRFCYAKRDADLEKACENLTRWAARR